MENRISKISQNRNHLKRLTNRDTMHWVVFSITLQYVLGTFESNCLQDTLDEYCRNLGTNDSVHIVGEHSNCEDARFARFDGLKWRCYTQVKSSSESNSCVSSNGDLTKCQDPDETSGFCTRNRILKNIIDNGCQGNSRGIPLFNLGTHSYLFLL